MKKIGFIGMGNMASAILHGIASSGAINPHDIMAYDIQKEQLDKVASVGIELASNEEELVSESEIIIMAIKPQVVDGVVERLKDNLKNKAIVSIVLGYDFEKYAEILDASTRHLSIMPNTPVQVREGILLFEDKQSLNPQEFDFVKNLMGSIGKVKNIPSHLMGVAGTLCGCGPAFMYMVIEALSDGAVKEGLPRQLAYELASQMILGAGKMQLETNVHPGILKDNVCSPGGSTIQGVEVLEQGKIRSLFIDAISKATHYK